MRYLVSSFLLLRLSFAGSVAEGSRSLRTARCPWIIPTLRDGEICARGATGRRRALSRSLRSGLVLNVLRGAAHFGVGDNSNGGQIHRARARARARSIGKGGAERLSTAERLCIMIYALTLADWPRTVPPAYI